LQGSALTIKVIRGDGEAVKVVVERQGATVGHLKRAIQRQVALNLLRDTGRDRSISWRYVWKTYWLSYEGDKLKDDNALLINLGIVNKASVNFVKRYRDKQNETRA
jgi:U11/U12 small nuclear ribonucleoprotein SNRNP25